MDIDAARGPSMMTASGRLFHPLDMRAEDIDIGDIAHSLAATARWMGHTREPFSVAQHSVLVARCVPAEDKLWAILHDASEAYWRDVPSPAKRMPEFQAYRDVEAGIMAAVCDRFGLPREEPASVRHADKVVLALEARVLRPRIDPSHARWYDGVEVPESLLIRSCWGHAKAKHVFLADFHYYMNMRENDGA